MKYFGILFSFYLILLTLMPCEDVAAIASNVKTSYTFHKDSGGMENCNQEGCAPFCSCACCAVGKHFPLQTSTMFIQPVARLSYPTYFTSAVKKQPVDVWQPPKLA